MIRRTDDLRITDVRPLIPPAILLEEIPISERASNIVADTRVIVTAIVQGRDPRLVVIVGPCSIHDTNAALEYAERLQPLADRYADQLVVLMRTYFEKPRTSVGWKGLINDPDLDESYHINKGLRLARKLLLDVNDLGLPTASEFLDTQIPQHIADLTSWVAIGARTTESQVHRELASGLSMPVGFKNSTDGSTQTAVDAVLAARSPHWFPSVTKQGVSAIFQTTGNDTCHVILRGGTRTGPNYDAEHVAQGLRAAGREGAARDGDDRLLARQQPEGSPQAGWTSPRRSASRSRQGRGRSSARCWRATWSKAGRTTCPASRRSTARASPTPASRSTDRAAARAARHGAVTSSLRTSKHEARARRSFWRTLYRSRRAEV